MGYNKCPISPFEVPMKLPVDLIRLLPKTDVHLHLDGPFGPAH